MTMFPQGSRVLQDRDNTRRLADRIESRDMFFPGGNVLENPEVGLLFIDFERGRRVRVEGTASIDEADPLVAEYPEAPLVWATDVLPEGDPALDPNATVL